MTEATLHTPVAFLVFNRPDLTARVFATIRQARPPVLLVVADGPRSDHPDDVPQCAATREVVRNIDWPCQVLTNFAETNLGCGKRVASGLDWVFQQVKEAIILEDDCLPHPSFFAFCQELLERYRNDSRVMHIGGNNFQHKRRTPYSYYFSRYNHIWGWATWRHAWRYYDNRMTLWPQVRDGGYLIDYLGNLRVARRWARWFEHVSQDLIDTWDYRWTFACWAHGGLTVLPDRNLVSNIGFGIHATHTKSSSIVANLSTEAMTFPLRHPPFMIRDDMADAYTERLLFRGSLRATLGRGWRWMRHMIIDRTNL